MKENRYLEFKSEITNTFLKTVSAFANFGDGRILFGVGDNGDSIGFDDPQKVCLLYHGLDMGLVNGTSVKCAGSNPGGSMHSFIIHDAVIAIRISDCRNISVRTC